MCGLLQRAGVRQVWLFGLLFAWAAAETACVTPGSARAGGPRIVYTPHSEPELLKTPEASRTTGASPTPDARRLTHTVAAGQTLYRIARTYEIPVEALMEANGITDPRTLGLGQVLVIPGATENREIVPPGAQEAPEVAVAESKAAPPPAQQARAEPKKRPTAVTLPKGPGVLDWPLRGVLYGKYGRKGSERHDGIDLAAPTGTPVKTAKAGTVLYAGEQKGYGRIAIIDHGGGLVTLYAHNRDVRVKTGQKVRDGQVVATVGSSGRTSGPHLHFEVRKDGMPVDPLKYLGAPPGKSAHGRRGRDANSSRSQ